MLPFPVELLRFLENATGSIKAMRTGDAQPPETATPALDRDAVEGDDAQLPHEETRAQLPSQSTPADQHQAKAT